MMPVSLEPLRKPAARAGGPATEGRLSTVWLAMATAENPASKPGGS